MRWLVGCEFSGVVRRAFRGRGHDAWSCDLLPAEDKSEHHIIADVRDVLGDGWDGAIFHPPCTHLAVSGARYFARKKASGVQEEALDFVRYLLEAPIPRIALENPVSVISTRIRKPDQIIQPYNFGENASKTTCLWLKGLPKLINTSYYPPRITATGARRWANQTEVTGSNIHLPSPDRWKIRSRTFQGIADAMADQWGALNPTTGPGVVSSSYSSGTSSGV